MEDLTQERLKELFHYDPATGVITRKVNAGTRGRAGDIAGCHHSNGYLRTMVDGKRYFNHRLAWFLHYGEWPKDQIDHINGVKTNNRISNLRDVSHSINLQNQKRAKSRNKLGILGVHASAGKFKAQIKLNGKAKHLGYFKNPELAHAAYLQAKRELHPGGML